MKYYEANFKLIHNYNTSKFITRKLNKADLTRFDPSLRLYAGEVSKQLVCLPLDQFVDFYA